MRTKIVAAGLCCLLAACTGCISLSRGEQEDLRVIKEAGLSTTDQRVKSPAVAGALNILPGVGNFYLALGTEETDMWVVGALNFLFWPVSVLWGIPEAAIDASTINKRETLYYYMRTERGRTELKDAQERMQRLPAIRR